MADVTERIIFDDTQAIKSIEELIKGLSTLQQQSKQTNDLLGNGSKAASDEIVRQNKKIDNAVIKTALSMREARAEAVKAVKDYTVFGVSIGGLSAKLTEAKNVLSLVRQSLVGNISATKTQAEGIETLTKVFGGGHNAIHLFVKGINLMKVAILSTGIGALVLSLGAIVTFFTKTNEGSEILEKKMAGLRAVFTVVTNAVSSVGKKIYEAFDNPKQAVTDLYEIIKKNLINRVVAIPDIFGAIGKAIKSAFTLNTDGAKAAIKDLSTSVVQFSTGLDANQQKGTIGYIKNVAKEANAARESAEKNWEKQDNLYDQETAAILKISKLRLELSKQRLISDDTTKSYVERIEAAKKAVIIESKIIDLQVGLAKQKAAILNEENRLKGASATDEDRRAATEALAEAYQQEASAFRLKKSLSNEVRSLEKEQLDFINGKVESLNKYSEELNKLGAEAGLVSADKERIRNLDDQLKLLQQQKKEIQAVSDAFFVVTGIRTMTEELRLSDKLIQKVTAELRRGENIQINPISPSARKDISDIKKEIERLKKFQVDFKIDTSKEQEKLQQKIKELEAAPLQPINKKVEINLDYVTNENKNSLLGDHSIYEDIQTYLEDVDDAKGLLEQALTDIFGEKGAKAGQEFLSGLQSGFSAYSSILQESIQLQISSNEELINQREKQRLKLEDDLAYELELQKEGLANNVGTKKEEVEALLAEEERYKKENEALKKKAQKNQLISDTIEQTSSLITSSINIIKGFSNIPVVGLGLGIAAAGALLAFFATTKAKAFAATKLHTGARKIDDYFGFTDKHGDTDIGSGQGYKVINARTGKDTNVVISGKEMLMKEKVSLANERFLLNMNKGVYDNVPIGEIIDNYMSLSSEDNKKIINNTIIRAESPTMQWVPIEINGKKGLILKEIRKDMAPGSTVWFN